MGKVDADWVNAVEDRLIALAAMSYRVANDLLPGRLTAHVSAQPNRCSTSPAANCAEARGSESR